MRRVDVAVGCFVMQAQMPDAIPRALTVNELKASVRASGVDVVVVDLVEVTNVEGAVTWGSRFDKRCIWSVSCRKIGKYKLTAVTVTARTAVGTLSSY